VKAAALQARRVAGMEKFSSQAGFLLIPNHLPASALFPGIPGFHRPFKMIELLRVHIRSIMARFSIEVSIGVSCGS
jgi:hypothetical protein